MWSRTDSPILTVGVTSALTFTGTGTNDLVVSGRPAFAATRQYVVEIQAGETYRWSNDNGATWEQSLVKIQINETTALRNAEGELEGISIRFGSVSGHVATDKWEFTTTGTVVAAAETDLNAGVSIVTKGAEGLILHGQYAKGAEDGVIIKVYPIMRPSSSYKSQISFPLSLGDGGLQNQQEYFQMILTANFTYRVNLTGVPAFKVTQQRLGAVGATGLLVCFAEMFKISR